MPLGFSKSVFSHKVAAAPAGYDPGYFQSTGTTSSGSNGAHLIADAGSGLTYSFNTGFTVSFWWKGTPSDLTTDNQAYIFRQLTTGDDGALVRLSNTGIDALLQEGSYGNTISLWQPASFSTNYLDDNWHHCALVMHKASANNEMYVDGTFVTGGGGGTIPSGNIINPWRYLYIGSNMNPSATTAYRDNGAGTLQISQLYLDPGATISLSANIDKFYDGGVVDMGSNGTSSGLSQPDIFLLGKDGNSNGGTRGTLTEKTEGTGDIGFFTSGGPN